MSYADALVGLTERIATIEGLVGYGNEEPHQVAPDAPYLFTKVYGYRRTQQGQAVVVNYDVLLRMLIRFQGDGTSDDALALFLNRIPAVFDPGRTDGAGHSYATLGGRVDFARIVDSSHAPDEGYITYGTTLFRYFDFILEIKERGATGSGL